MQRQHQSDSEGTGAEAQESGWPGDQAGCGKKKSDQDQAGDHGERLLRGGDHAMGVAHLLVQHFASGFAAELGPGKPEQALEFAVLQLKREVAQDSGLEHGLAVAGEGVDRDEEDVEQERSSESKGQADPFDRRQQLLDHERRFGGLGRIPAAEA